MSTPTHYDIIRRPLITEKATTISENNTYAFEVDINASKIDIRKAVEGIFDVKVLKITTSILKGKTKRFRGRFGKRSDIKKAFVRIQDGQDLDLSLGI